MRRIIIIVMLVIISTSMIGCSNKKGMSEDEKIEMQQRKMDMKYSEDLIKTYMDYIMTGDNQGVDSLLTPEVKNKNPINKQSYPKPLGYKLEQVEKVGDDMIASVNVVESKSEKSYCSILNMSYTMSKINNKNMLIKRIDNNGQLAFFLDIKQNVKVFVTKEDNAAKGTVVFDVSEIPSYMVVKSAQEPLRKVELSREDFGPVAISNDGKHMMITSRKNGNDVLIMIEKVSQVFNIAGGPTGSGGPQGGDGSKQESQVRNIEMQAIDYFEGSTVENIAISPSGDFIVAMVKSGNNTKLSIYSTYNKEILLLKVMEKFKVDEYTILNSYFNDKDTIVLTVKNLKKNINENYSISIKTDEISKLD